MITNSNASTIPAGLVDDKIEFFSKNGEVVFLQSGSLHDFNELTINDYFKIVNCLFSDKNANKGLDLLGITDQEERLMKFVSCRFCGFNPEPDIDGEELNYEYWDCGNRPCPAEGLLCRFPEVKNGHLTRHDATIIRAICNDMLNKEIADDLGISVETVNRECKNIAEKIGVTTKAGIAAFGGKNHIL